MNHAGNDIDRQVALSLFGEWREPIPEFSTRDVAADYLVRLLKRSRVQAVIDIQNGSWRCRLSNGRELASTGTGDTRPLAICRAVLAARFEADRHPAEAVAPRAAGPRSPERSPYRCATCGISLVASKGPANRPRFCNLCSWERGREKLVLESRAHRARG